VKAQAKAGYYLILDQCLRCGGIWCANWELYRLADSQAQQLDSVDTEGLHVFAAAGPQSGRCPHCGILLRGFADPLVPADVRIERCKLCEGMWLDAGMVRRYAAHRAPRESGRGKGRDARRTRHRRPMLGRCAKPPCALFRGRPAG